MRMSPIDPRKTPRTSQHASNNQTDPNANQTQQLPGTTPAQESGELIPGSPEYREKYGNKPVPQIPPERVVTEAPASKLSPKTVRVITLTVGIVGLVVSLALLLLGVQRIIVVLWVIAEVGGAVLLHTFLMRGTQAEEHVEYSQQLHRERQQGINPPATLANRPASVSPPDPTSPQSFVQRVPSRLWYKGFASWALTGVAVVVLVANLWFWSTASWHFGLKLAASIVVSVLLVVYMLIVVRKQRKRSKRRRYLNGPPKGSLKNRNRLVRFSYVFDDDEHTIHYGNRDNPVHLVRRTWLPLLIAVALVFGAFWFSAKLSAKQLDIIIGVVVLFVLLAAYLSTKWFCWAFVVTNKCLRLVRIPPRWFPWMEQVNRRIELQYIKLCQEDATHLGSMLGWGNVEIGTYLQDTEDKYFRKIMWMTDYEEIVRIISDLCPNLDVQQLQTMQRTHQEQVSTNTLLEVIARGQQTGQQPAAQDRQPTPPHGQQVPPAPASPPGGTPRRYSV